LVAVRGGTEAAKAEARRRFLAPLLEHLETGGLGHVAEVADAEPPHAPGGCPFQAWSLGELIRIERMLAAAPMDSSGLVDREAVHGE
jgi:glycogen debranching enzyme